MCHKEKLKFEDYKHCLEATHLENKINNLQKNKLNVDSYRENHKEFIKNSRLIVKSQQRFRSKKHNVFIEEVNKIALSANNDTINRFSKNIGILNKQRNITQKERN